MDTRTTFFHMAALASALALAAALAGCGSPAPAQPSSSASGPEAPAADSSSAESITGGWEVNADVANSFLDAAEQAALAEAAEAGGAYCNAVSLLATGPESSAYLCQYAADGDAGKTAWGVAAVEQDGDSARIASFEAIDPVDLKAQEGFDLPEGWTRNEIRTGKPAMMPEDAQAAFEALDTGSQDILPLGLVASQLVSGMNYLFVAQVAADGADDAPGLAFLVIYRDLQGNASVTAEEPMDLAAYLP